jgi:AmmeMemoRadiSam system protein B
MAQTLAHIRPPAVAGMFYPGTKSEIHRQVAGFLAAVETSSGPAPKALIAPHAGYVYSGPIAASAYALLAPLKGRVSRVVLIGPSHRVAFRGLALCRAAAYALPGLEIPIDLAGVATLLDLPFVGYLDQAHAQEHSLEVHLPFLAETLGSFSLLPIVAGEALPEEVDQALDAVWGGPETLIVISTDLSHYLDYESARRTDARTGAAIERLDERAIDQDQACGRIPVSGLLHLARRKGLAVKTLDMRNSGDTAGPRDRVVGYGAWAFYETRNEERGSGA